MSIFKKIGKLVSKIIPGGGIIADIIAPGKSPAQVEAGLASLDPIAQYNRTMARPRIALTITYTYVLGVIVQWVQQLAGVAKEELITIPDTLLSAFTLAISFYIGSRGVEKVVSSITGFIKKKKRRKKK